MLYFYDDSPQKELDEKTRRKRFWFAWVPLSVVAALAISVILDSNWMLSAPVIALGLWAVDSGRDKWQ